MWLSVFNNGKAVCLEPSSSLILPRSTATVVASLASPVETTNQLTLWVCRCLIATLFWNPTFPPVQNLTLQWSPNLSTTATLWTFLQRSPLTSNLSPHPHAKVKQSAQGCPLQLKTGKWYHLPRNRVNSASQVVKEEVLQQQHSSHHPCPGQTWYCDKESESWEHQREPSAWVPSICDWTAQKDCSWRERNRRCWSTAAEQLARTAYKGEKGETWSRRSQWSTKVDYLTVSIRIQNLKIWPRNTATSVFREEKDYWRLIYPI